MPSPRGRGSSADPHPPLTNRVCSRDGHRRNVEPTSSGSVSRPVLRQCPPSAESPLAPSRHYLSGGGLRDHLGGRYSSFVAHTGSCARPNPSRRLRSSLAWRVFAGCCQPLLRDGPSRRYLHNPCAGAGTPTPPRSSGALTRFLPGGRRPHLRLKRFGARKLPTTRLRREVSVSRLQPFSYVPAPTLARPPDRAHRGGHNVPPGGWAVYTTQWTNSCLLDLWHRYMSESGN